jgi:hypothetical protein
MGEDSILLQSYIQKSRVFLLPLTGLIKHETFKSLNTYISSDVLNADDYPKGIKPRDEILIVTYPKEYKRYRIKTEFEKILEEELEVSPWESFESKSIMSNRNFMAYHELEDEMAYTFDMSKFSGDWTNFLRGRYSLFTQASKEKIINFRWSSLGKRGQKQLHSYLYPERYMKEYAEQLGVPVEELLEVKELCSKPNLTLENYNPMKLKLKRERDEIES